MYIYKYIMNKVIPTLTIKPNKLNKRKNIENFKQMIEPKPPIIVVKKNKKLEVRIYNQENLELKKNSY